MNTELKNDLACVSVYSDNFNRRIRIDDYSGDLHEVHQLIRQAIPEWTDKLIVKSRKKDLPFFFSRGFSCEAFIKNYFDGVDMYFAVQYFTPGREFSKKWYEEQTILDKIMDSRPEAIPGDLSEVKIAKRDEAGQLASLYAEIFKVYPTVLRDPIHLGKTIDDGTIYAYILEENRIVSAASAELNVTYHNAELTDCGTLEQSRGKGHMKKILSTLENILTAREIKCFYSICRAESYGMNLAFRQLGYTYGGRLINNCRIVSGLEDMNVWYKETDD